jgi:glutamyl-Q tRNA(Asp) synthetase
MHDPTIRYRGRFAPSPTGPLHFGSLIAAVGSCLEARRNGGEWRVRMEDLDRPREEPGAADAILRTLEAYGFEWDGPVLRQSVRGEAYAAALARLQRGGFVFACACTRREISDSALGGAIEPVYPGTCRNGIAPGRAPRAIRTRVDDAVIGFDDRFQGRVEQDLASEVGDFVVKRPTACSPTSWPWWWTISSRASRTWCAARTCSPRRQGRCCCSAAWATRRRDTRTCPSR